MLYDILAVEFNRLSHYFSKVSIQGLQYNFHENHDFFLHFEVFHGLNFKHLCLECTHPPLGRLSMPCVLAFLVTFSNKQVSTKECLC